MDATEALHLLRLLGLNLETDNGRLIVTPADLLDDDVRWFIRNHRAGIIDALQKADDPAWAWLVHLNGRAIETYHHPEKNCAGVARMYPDAARIEPLPECLWPHDPNKQET